MTLIESIEELGSEGVLDFYFEKIRDNNQYKTNCLLTNKNQKYQDKELILPLGRIILKSYLLEESFL